jgi:protein-S-isoprenylcysteine O-methyltransferase Ste14
VFAKFVRHAIAIIVLPVTATILVPRWICRTCAAVMPPIPFAIGAALAFLAGATLFVSTAYLFATAGRGTLAPWDPPERLVVRGPYRFVRNPMITGVLLIIVAEALFFRSLPIAMWAAGFLAVNAIYLPLLEEPGLERRFGDDYRTYKREVPRLVPRLTSRRSSARPPASSS